jgi:hypothetical protein
MTGRASEKAALFHERRGLFHRYLGYSFVAIGLALLALAWVRSYPIDVESRISYLYDSIYPSFWIGLSVANIGLFLVARNSKKHWVLFGCGVAFFLLAYSIKYFFTFLPGPDSNWFRAISEDFLSNRTLRPGEVGYHQWPLLFTLVTVTCEVLGVSVHTASDMLFASWNVVFAGCLFLYVRQGNDVWNFLSVVAYGIAMYPFLVWQFAPQTFSLTLLMVCAIMISKDGVSWRVAAIVVYAALILSHAFLPFFLLVAACVMSIRNRRRVALAASFGLLYGVYVVFYATRLVGDVAEALVIALFLEYMGVAKATLLQPVSWLDAFGQTVSRSVTLSMWGLLILSTILCLLLRKLRTIDLSLGISGLVYAIVGAVVPILGWRGLQIVTIPATYALRALSRLDRGKKAVLVYFFLALAIFPLGLIHLFYNDTNYMTFREQHAAETVFVTTFGRHAQGDCRVMIEDIVGGYIRGKVRPFFYYSSEQAPRESLLDVTRFCFIFMDPLFEKNLLKRAELSDSDLQRLEAGTLLFSRVYSNGQVVILQNPKVAELVGLQAVSGGVSHKLVEPSPTCPHYRFERPCFPYVRRAALESGS